MNWSDNIQVFNADCLEAIKGMEDDAFDLAIVDPEYGIDAANMTMGKGSGNDTGKHKKKDWDKKPPSREYFTEARRVSVDQVIWGGNYFHLPPSRCWLLWDKKDYNSDFASHEMAWTSFDKVVKCYRRSRSKDNDNRGKIHPTQKPVQLYNWILDNYAKEGDTILDTHLGSGSIAIACHYRGFELTGYEIDPDYYQAALKRFKQVTSQKQLFSK